MASKDCEIIPDFFILTEQTSPQIWPKEGGVGQYIMTILINNPDILSAHNLVAAHIGVEVISPEKAPATLEMLNALAQKCHERILENQADLDRQVVDYLSNQD